MTTETSKHSIPEISHEAFIRAAALAESNTRVGRFHPDEDIEMIRLYIVESRLLFKVASPSLLVAAMIDALAAKDLVIWDPQAQIDKLRTGGSDNG